MPSNVSEDISSAEVSAIAPLNPHSLGVKATLLLSSTLVIMSGATIAPSLPAMGAYFSDVENQEYWVRLVLTMPALTIIFASALAGQIVDRLGRKWLLLASTILFGLAGSSGYFLNSLGTILVSRALLGVAVGGAITSVTTLLADYYQGSERAKLMGLQSTVISLGGFFAFSLGGLLAEISWRLPFLIYLFGLILSPLVVFFLFEPDTKPYRDMGERNPAKPQLSFPWKIVGLIYGIEFLHMFSFYITPVQLPFYLKEKFDLSASFSGFAIAGLTLAQAAIGFFYSFLKNRASFLSLISLALILIGIGYGCISFSVNYWQVIASLIISGFGFGLLMPNSKVWLTQVTEESLRGRALGGLTTAFYLGEFFSPLTSQALIGHIGLQGTYQLFSFVLLCLAILFWTIRQQS